MEYLVTMTTHVPDGTADEIVEGIRARDAAQAHDLWRAQDAAEMQAALQSLPLYDWCTVETTPLSPQPNDPAIVKS